MNRMILLLNVAVLVVTFFLALSISDSQIGVLNSTSEAANAPRLSRQTLRDDSAVAYLRVVQSLESTATKSVLDALTVDQLFAIRTAMARYQSSVSRGVLLGLAEGGDAKSVRAKWALVGREARADVESALYSEFDDPALVNRLATEIINQSR